VKKTFSSYTFPCDFSRKENVFSSAKISYDLLLVIDSKNSQFHITLYILIYPFFFPKYANFPLNTSPNLSCTEISFPPKMLNNFLPAKMAKQIISSLNWL